MATGTQPVVSLETYLHSTYEPDAEYVDGEIEERPMGEFDHASWQEAILAWFRLHADKWNVRARPELRVQVATDRYRVPDVVVLDRALPVEQIVTRPPLAVFEILSPEDTMQRILHKLADYAAMGIAQIWVIDPKRTVSFRYTNGSLQLSETFGSPGGRMHFAMQEIAALLD